MAAKKAEKLEIVDPPTSPEKKKEIEKKLQDSNDKFRKSASGSIDERQKTAEENRQVSLDG